MFIYGCKLTNTIVPRARFHGVDRDVSLLVGAAAAKNHPERQYLMAQLVRFGFSIALDYIEDFKRTFTIDLMSMVMFLEARLTSIPRATYKLYLGSPDSTTVIRAVRIYLVTALQKGILSSSVSGLICSMISKQ